jgi:hypothetical protein
MGYWVVEDASNIIYCLEDYREQILQSSRVSKDNQNPFTNFHINDLIETDAVLEFLSNFYAENIERTPSAVSDCWANYYNKDTFSCIESCLLPHCDTDGVGIAANLWLSKDLENTGTDLYAYAGNQHDLIETYHNLRQFKTNKYLNKDWTEYGFEYIGRVPAKYNTITIYRSDWWHTAYIPETTQERLSCGYVYASC